MVKIAEDSIANHDYPDDQNLPHKRNVTIGALRKVKAVLAMACAKGWTEESLLTNRGTMPCPYGNQYGLVCFVENGEIGAITPEQIEIIHRLPDRTYQTRFTNPERYRKLTPQQIEQRAEAEAKKDFGG